MSKASIDTNTTETLIYKAENLKSASDIRVRLVNSSSNCWFFLYTQSSEIYATNEFGGRLTKEKTIELQALAKSFSS